MEIKENTFFLQVVDQYNAAGVLLGLSSLFSWICILRYLSFFEKYNVSRTLVFVFIIQRHVGFFS